MAQNLATAEGLIALPEERLRITLANSARLRTVLSLGRSPAIATEAAALDHIFVDDLPFDGSGEDHAASPAELEDLRPYVLVGTQAEAGFQLNFEAVSASGAGAWMFQNSGVLVATIVAEVLQLDQDVQDEGRLNRLWKNHVGTIIDELGVMAGEPDRLAIRRIVHNGPIRNHPADIDDEGDTIASELVLEWGRRS